MLEIVIFLSLVKGKGIQGMGLLNKGGEVNK